MLFNERMDGKKRVRKTEDQVGVLLEEYEKNPKWTRKIMQRLSEKTGLKVTQVYKWLWDQKNKSE